MSLKLLILLQNTLSEIHVTTAYNNPEIKFIHYFVVFIQNFVIRNLLIFGNKSLFVKIILN